MSPLLGSPLIVTACASVAVALAGLAHPFAALGLGAAVSATAAFLAAASAGMPRTVLWSATSLATAAVALRGLAPLPPLRLPGAAAVDVMRSELASALATLVPEPESGILLGIVLGERASIGAELRDAFAATGTAHLLAISGFNMTLVAAAVAIALRGRIHPIGIALATAGTVAAYTALVGPAPSVLRAALMASVGAIGLAVGRRGAAGNALGAAVTAMLMLDPRALEDVGSLLSVTATAGLIVAQRPLATRFARLPSPVAEGLAATLAASVPTIPIVAAVFGRVSLVSPLANLVAVPLFAPILLLGAATAAVGAVLPAAAGPLAVAAFAATLALRVSVEAFAAVPFASAVVPSGPLTALALAALIVFVAYRGPTLLSAMGRAIAAPMAHLPLPTIPPRRPHLPARMAGTLLCALALVAGLAAAQAVPRPAAMKVRALDVGQGDAFLLESAGRYALIDGGPDPARLLRELGRALAPWQRRIDVVALTHEHADHGNGLLAVLERYDVGLAIEPAGMGDEPLVRAWAERAERSGVRRVALTAGARVRLGHVTLRALAPGRDRAASVPNLVLLAEAPEGSVLFMADATDDAIADLLLAPDDLAARLYVPPHHGADTAHAIALVEAVRPRAAVISVGASNRYGHPTAGTLAALGSLPVYRTDRHGTVEVELDGDGIRIRTDKAGVPPHRGGSVPGSPPSR